MHQNSLTAATIPTLSSIAWSKTFSNPSTAKAVEMLDASSIVVLLWGGSYQSVSLVKLSHGDGSI